jgi:chemosensory pili system protein ChpA (sensor histidine kinase/response regulator)
MTLYDGLQRGESVAMPPLPTEAALPAHGAQAAGPEAAIGTAVARDGAQLPAAPARAGAPLYRRRHPRPAETAPATAAAGTASSVRVRADVLDKLVDQAGEVSIARAKLEKRDGPHQGRPQ